MRTAASILVFTIFVQPVFSYSHQEEIADAAYSNPVQTVFSSTTYADDPAHIWNQLFRLFYVRQDRDGLSYGGDELDPYLWDDTKYLLSGSSRRKALRLLDHFLEQHSEKLITDPLKRAFFQRDLLAVYDWLASTHGEQRQDTQELQKRIAEVIRRLSLTGEQIKKLPDNYADAVAARVFPASYDTANAHQAFLPNDLFSNGDWVCLGEQQGRPVASDHLQSFHGRSVFLVFFSLPGGRAQTLEYLARLRDIPKTWGPNQDLAAVFGGQTDNTRLVPYPEPPQFPIGTKVALVRQAVLLNNSGRLVQTHLTENVQIRVYRAIHFDLGGTGSHSQDFFEFRMSRERLFSGSAGGLRAVVAGEKDFPVFKSHGNDMFEDKEQQPGAWAGDVLRSCSSCHEAAGMHSFLSYSRERFGPYDVSPPKLILSDPLQETGVQIRWTQQYGVRLGADN